MSGAVGPAHDETPAEIVRRARGKVSQETFAAQLGTTRQTVIDWEKGRTFPNEENAAKLAALAGVPAATLLRRPAEEPVTVALTQLAGELTELGGFVRQLDPNGRQLARAEDVRELADRLAALEVTVDAMARLTADALTRMEGAIERLSDSRQSRAPRSQGSSS